MNEQKMEPGAGEKHCPYDGVVYRDIPGYISGYGCPVCNATGSWHIPVSKDAEDSRICDIEIRVTFDSYEWSCFKIKHMTEADFLRLKRFLLGIKNKQEARLGFVNQDQSPDPDPDLDSES